MKKILIILFLAVAAQASGQLAVNLMIPPLGLMEKQQLWNMLVTNPGPTVVQLRIELVLTEANTGQQVLGAVAGPIPVMPGTRQLSATGIGNVLYQVTNGAYRIDPGPTGLLPIGRFNACYQFITDAGKPLARECVPVEVRPLTPLLLNLPLNHSTQEELSGFSWMPFSSAPFLNQLSYSLKLVEIYPGQSAADALQKNFPLLTARQLSAPNLAYGPAGPKLEAGKQYAWQVTAMNHLNEVARSEIWDFRMGETGGGPRRPDPVFARLKKEPEDAGYAVFHGELRFAYFNETPDTTWNVQLTDIGGPKPRTLRLVIMDTLKMEPGENLVRISGPSASVLSDKHLYLLRMINSRNETWQLKFQFRKEDQ